MGTGKVILLNGCSSSGKTTLATKLQQMLDEPYQHIALDQFRDGLPASTRGLNAPDHTEGAQGLNVVPDVNDKGEPITHIKMGGHADAVLAAMRRSVALFAQSGLHVIVDDLILKPNYLEDYQAVLNPTQTWLVAVRCELEVIEQREAARIGRFPGTAKSHYTQVHDHGFDYDLELDTSDTSPRALALQVIERLNQPPAALARRA